MLTGIEIPAIAELPSHPIKKTWHSHSTMVRGELDKKYKNSPLSIGVIYNQKTPTATVTAAAIRVEKVRPNASESKRPPPPPPSLSSKVNMGDIAIDQWASKMFSIIKSGPSGGFVRYAIDSRNKLFVEKTGNRALLEDVVDDLLPVDACRYIAYQMRIQKGPMFSTKMVWFLWTPKAAPEKEPARYTTGLASALIGLHAPSSIPILKGNLPSDLEFNTVMKQI